MSRLGASILKREQIVERLAAHPFTLSLGAVMVFAQAIIFVGEVAGIPFARWIALDLSAPQAGAMLFPFAHYAPVAPDMINGAGFSALDFIAGVTLFFVCGVTLLTCGPAVESYYGTRRVFAAFLLCSLGHALVAATMPAGVAFSTMAFATFLVVTSLLIQLERREAQMEQQNDLRMALLLAAVVLAAMAAGFVPHPSYDSLLTALGVGPALAVVGFVVNRKLQMRAVRLRGEGKVGSMYFVEEIDLLTRQEVERRMDLLLEKIAAQGINSLATDEHRFLKAASRRMKAIDQAEEQAEKQA